MNRDQTDYIVLCPSGTTPDKDIGLKEMDSRDRQRGYFRCVYHFVIRRDGTIEHGHRKHTEPAMGLRGYNPVSVSICIIGGAGEPVIERAQIESVKALIAELLEDYPTAQVLDYHQTDKRAAPLELAKYFTKHQEPSS